MTRCRCYVASGTAGGVVRRDGEGLPPLTPSLSPPRGPPQSDLLVELPDQTPAFDPAEAVLLPDFDFDQSRPDDFDL
jgi:hypothetical protein